MTSTSAEFAFNVPGTQLVPQRLSSAARLAALGEGKLDVVLVRERRGLKWVAFPRADSSVWLNELTATLRSHGIYIELAAHDELELIAAIKFAAVSAGRAFALAPPNRATCIPEGVVDIGGVA